MLKSQRGHVRTPQLFIVQLDSFSEDTNTLCWLAPTALRPTPSIPLSPSNIELLAQLPRCSGVRGRWEGWVRAEQGWGGVGYAGVARHSPTHSQKSVA